MPLLLYSFCWDNLLHASTPARFYGTNCWWLRLHIIHHPLTSYNTYILLFTCRLIFLKKLGLRERNVKVLVNWIINQACCAKLLPWALQGGRVMILLSPLWVVQSSLPFCSPSSKYLSSLPPPITPQKPDNFLMIFFQEQILMTFWSLILTSWLVLGPFLLCSLPIAN